MTTVVLLAGTTGMFSNWNTHALLQNLAILVHYLSFYSA